MRHLDDLSRGLQYYHNKLIREGGGTLVEVLDVPCQRLDVWWNIKRQMDEEAASQPHADVAP